MCKFTNVRTLMYKSINSVVKLGLELFVFDRNIRRGLKGDFCKLFLKKYITETESEPVIFSANPDKKYRIWQYWDKGIENAPDIVKACMNSVDKYRGDIERVIITEDTVKDYVSIPDYIYELRKEGIITPTHFSDILRTYLLYEHGGCWIDATVLMTAPFPEYIRQSELFVLKNIKEEDPDRLNMASYFLSSKGHSVIIAKSKNFLEKYWKENRFMINYFLFLHGFTMLTESSQENVKEWGDITYVPYLTVQKMQGELLGEYDEEKFEKLKSETALHKLSYKWRVLTKKKNFDVAGTLYQHIIDEYVAPEHQMGVRL